MEVIYIFLRLYWPLYASYDIYNYVLERKLATLVKKSSLRRLAEHISSVLSKGFGSEFVAGGPSTRGVSNRRDCFH